MIPVWSHSRGGPLRDFLWVRRRRTRPYLVWAGSVTAAAHSPTLTPVRGSLEGERYCIHPTALCLMLFTTTFDRCWGRGGLACETSSHKGTSKLDGRVWESCDTSVLCTILFTTVHIFWKLHYPGPFGTAESSPVQQILVTHRLRYTYYGHHSVCHTSTHNLRPHTWLHAHTPNINYEKFSLSGLVPGHEEGPDGIVQDTVGALTLAQSCSAHAVLEERQPNGQGQQTRKPPRLHH